MNISSLAIENTNLALISYRRSCARGARIGFRAVCPSKMTQRKSSTNHSTATHCSRMPTKTNWRPWHSWRPGRHATTRRKWRARLPPNRRRTMWTTRIRELREQRLDDASFAIFRGVERPLLDRELRLRRDSHRVEDRCVKIGHRDRILDRQAGTFGRRFAV